MSRHHFVRVGALGHVGRFAAVDAVRYPRLARVIVRTSRGLEIGEVLGPSDAPMERGASDGAILRGMTVEDELVDVRLSKNKDRALRACQQRLDDLGLRATLLDVEHLFDGRSLFFYFLGEVTTEVEAVTQQLAEAYDSVAQFRNFSEAVTVGCGPGCGTQDAEGSGCTSCATQCVIGQACATSGASRYQSTN
jgi:cell fate regulator YaaT (PSP1 superfamily)